MVSFNWIEVVTSLMVATTLSIVIALVYMLTHKRRGYDQDLIQTLIFMSAVIASVMLVIGNNIVGAFGLVGAVSVIRFRTRLENPQDTAFIFFEMAVGLSCGLKQYAIAGITTVFICAVLIIFWKINFARTVNPQNGNLLSIKVANVMGGRRAAEYAFVNQVINWELVSINSLDDKRAIIDYRVILKENVTSGSFIQKIYEAAKGEFSVLRYEIV